MAQKQINVSMPKEWLEQLEQLASSYPAKKLKTRSHFRVFFDVITRKQLQESTASCPEASVVKKGC